MIVVFNELTIESITKSMLFHSGEPYVTTNQIAKYFGVNHKDLLRKIRSFHSFDDLISRRKITPQKKSLEGKRILILNLMQMLLPSHV